MNANTQSHRDYSFVIGLLTGTFVGAGLATWLAPRFASQYQQASTRVGEVVDELTRKSQDVRNDVADAVVRGAHEVERYATAAKSDGVTEARKHAAADRSASKRRSL